jgi:hypothetical protein
MSEYIVQEHNASTGEVTFRPATLQELEIFEDDKIQSEKNKADALEAKANKAALLERLGITEEEARLLLS